MRPHKSIVGVARKNYNHLFLHHKNKTKLINAKASLRFFRYRRFAGIVYATPLRPADSRWNLRMTSKRSSWAELTRSSSRAASSSSRIRR